MEKKPNPEVLHLATKEGKRMDIPVQGCLGLLALGDIGLVTWRQKRDQAKQQEEKKSNQK